MKPKSLKNKVIEYRKRGYSYSMISEKLGLARGTLSNWLQEIPCKLNKEAIKRIKLARLKSAQFKHNQRIANVTIMKKLAKRELGKLTKRDLWLLGIGLYIGEGNKASKESVRIINSDPKIIKIAMEWFREICGLKSKNFSPAVHLYPDNDIAKAINYWSKIISIPKKQFGKTQIDIRTNKSGRKKKKLLYGTLHLQIKSCGEKEFGVSLHRRIMGWIETALDQI